MDHTTPRSRWARYRDLVIALAWEDLKVRYKSPVLGFLWSLVTPLVLLITFSFVFTKVIHLEMANYPIYLLLGLFPWNFLSLSLLTGTTVFVSNARLVKNVAFPRLAIPIAIVLTQLVHYVLALALLLASLPLMGLRYPSTCVWLPVVVALQSCFILGLLLICSALHVYLRDMKYIVEVGMTGWFYLTPIFYAPTMIPEPWRQVCMLNPMAALVTLFRHVLLEPQTPWYDVGVYAAVASLATCIVGVALFRRLAPRFADRV